MGKPKKKKRRPTAPTASAMPKVHVQLAAADTDLAALAQLAKPALLYADTVTIYSPAATLMQSIASFGEIRSTEARMRAALTIYREVPQLADRSGLTPDNVAALQSLARLSPAQLAMIGRATGDAEAMAELGEMLHGLDRIWDEDFPAALEQIKTDMRARELFTAMDARAVKVAELPGGGDGATADAVRRALGDRTSGMIDELLSGFIASVVQILEDPKAFPLLDARSSGLVRALENEGSLALPSTMPRGAEISSATSFMSFLPYFPILPMDEVLDLRKDLGKPLIRFRAAMARLGPQFASRPIDDSFDESVEDAWRTEVAPALAEIREALAEHGLLREVRSVVEGDFKTLIKEAGGVLAVSAADVINLSGLMTAGVATGLPIADVALRALGRHRTARHEIRRNAFYFLHRLAEGAEQHQPR